MKDNNTDEALSIFKEMKEVIESLEDLEYFNVSPMLERVERGINCLQNGEDTTAYECSADIEEIVKAHLAFL